MSSLGDGRYVLKERLGAGGMASVWRAEDSRLATVRAIKLLDPALARHQDFRDRFLREAQVMARLRHRNLPIVHDFGVDGEQPYFVMELITGGSLRSRVDSENLLSVREVGLITLALLDGLSMVHGAGIVHRDVKPDNIMMDDWGQPVLVDFGIAQVEMGAAAITKANQRLGSFAYMAPEQLQNPKDVDSRADLYSVGATMAALLRGVDPFDLRDHGARADALATLPDELRGVIDRATQTRPEDRYTSARTMAVELSDHLGLSLPEWFKPRTTEPAMRKPAADKAPTEPTLAGLLDVEDHVTAPAPVRSGRETRVWAAGAALLVLLAVVGVRLAGNDADTTTSLETVESAASTPAASLNTSVPPAPVEVVAVLADPATTVEPPVAVVASTATAPSVSTVGSPAAKATSTTTPTTAARVAASASRTVSTAPVAARTAEATSSAAEKGMLKVMSLPWSDVVVDGRPRGRTPWSGEVDVGARHIELESPEMGSRSLDVQVDANAVRTVCWDFHAGSECQR